MLADKKDPGTGRRRVLALVSVLLSGAFAFVVAEVIVRLTFRYNTPDTVKANSLQYLPTIFAQHRLRPNQDVNTEAAWGDREDDGWAGSRYVINREGYRGAEIAIPKPEHTCRIVILGGSAVFGVKGSEEDNWPFLVGRYLQERGYENIEVVNGGVPGHASFDSLGRLYSQVWMFEPDIVLVYNVWNDIKFVQRIEETAPVTPLLWVVFPLDDTANPFMNYRNSFDKLLSSSQIYVKLRTRYYKWKLRPGLEGSLRENQFLNATYGKLGLRQFRLNYEMIVDTARNIDAVPALLTQATLVTPDARQEDRERIRYEYQRMDHETLARAFTDFNDVIRSVARDKKAPYLDLDEEFSGRSELFLDHVHLTQRGCMEIARRVGGFLEQVLSETNQCEFLTISSPEDGAR
jgi:lysophospholipase L1-like esterase